MESRVQGQILKVAMLVSQGDFSSNATILRSVKSISGADVISFDVSGHVLASTLEAVIRDLLELARPRPSGSRRNA